jgi:7-cyano-7-deazaguanine synthase in queuosine biosynthesis
MGKTSVQGALALALSLACTQMAQAANDDPKKVYSDCVDDAEKAKEAALKLCTGKTGDQLRNCQTRAQSTRTAADARCTLRMQQAVNAAGARDRERAARDAARSGRPQ